MDEHVFIVWFIYSKDLNVHEGNKSIPFLKIRTSIKREKKKTTHNKPKPRENNQL